jgi:hypothetical protein
MGKEQEFSAIFAKVAGRASPLVDVPPVSENDSLLPTSMSTKPSKPYPGPIIRIGSGFNVRFTAMNRQRLQLVPER